jgi:hypothetical protein
LEPPKFSRTSKSELQVGKISGGNGGPLIPTYKLHPQKFNPKAIMKWDMGKLKTWFVFDLKIIQTKTMENPNAIERLSSNWKM